jgi:MFS family permease
MFYISLIAAWFLFGLLGAGFYVAYGKRVTGRLERSRRHKVLIFTAMVAVVFGPLSIAAAALEMCKKRTWYGWTLW